LFVSRKTNQAGKRFGFVTIHSNLSDKTLLECLNDIWFDSYKLRVNVAKHRRKDEVMKQKPVGIGKQISKHSNKAKAPIRVRDNRSYL
jgi:RNA recognition motif-containing protein